MGHVAAPRVPTLQGTRRYLDGSLTLCTCVMCLLIPSWLMVIIQFFDTCIFPFQKTPQCANIIL